MNEKEILYYAIGFIMVLILCGAGAGCEYMSPRPTAPPSAVDSIKNQQQAVRTEIGAAGNSAERINEAITKAEGAVDGGTGTAGDIQAGINQAQCLLKECQELTASNRNILEGAAAKPGEGTPEGKGD